MLVHPSCICHDTLFMVPRCNCSTYCPHALIVLVAPQLMVTFHKRLVVSHLQLSASSVAVTELKALTANAWLFKYCKGSGRHCPCCCTVFHIPHSTCTVSVAKHLFLCTLSLYVCQHSHTGDCVLKEGFPFCSKS